MAYIPELKFSRSELNKKIKEENQKWLDKKEKERKRIFGEYKFKLLREGKEIPDIDFSVDDKSFLGRIAATSYKELPFDPEKEDERDKWKKYYFQKRKENAEKLSPIDLEIEIRRGGVLDENLAFSAFGDGYIKGSTLGIWNPKHPIYGDMHKKIYSTAYNYGDMFGGLTAFMSLSKVASVAKIPNIIAKLKNVKYARTVLKSAGFLKFQAGKLGRLKFLMQTMADMTKVGVTKIPAVTKVTAKALGTMESAGAISITSGLIGSFMSGVKNEVAKLRKEDKLSLKEYHTSLPRALLEGFFQKYFIGVINAPQGVAGWPARILGDAVYSMGQQIYRVTTGQQEDYNTEDFWRSFIEGHLLGEIQGFVFAPNKKQMVAQHHDSIARWYNDQIVKKFAKWNVTPKEAWSTAAACKIAEIQKLAQTGKYFTDDEKNFAVEKLGGLYKQGYKLYLGTQRGEIDTISKVVKIGAISKKGFNSTTGIKADMDAGFMKSVDKNGSYIISASGAANDLRRDGYGNNISYAVMKKIGQRIKDNISGINNKYKKHGSMDMRNPIDEESTKFVITQEGLGEKEFKDAVFSIHKDLQQTDISERGFNIAIGDEKILSGFDNISITKVEKGIAPAGATYKLSTQYEILKNVSAMVNPTVKPLLDKSFINDKTFTMIEQANKIFPLVYRTDQEWVNLFKSSPKKTELMAQLLENISKETEIIEDVYIERQNEIEKQAIGKEEPVKNRTGDGGFIENAVLNNIEEMRNDGFISSMVRGGGYAKEKWNNFWGSIYQWWQHKGTTFEGMEEKSVEGQKAVEGIYRQGNIGNISERDIETGLKMMYGNHHHRVIGDKSWLASDRLMPWLTQREKWKLINKKTGKWIDPNKLIDPKKSFIKNPDNDADIDRFVENPRLITHEYISALIKVEHDPLLLSKILVNYFEIDPKSLIGLIDRTDKMWYKPTQEYISKVYDKNSDWQMGIKTEMEKYIKKALIDMNPRLKEKISKLNFATLKKEEVADVITRFGFSDAMKSRLDKSLGLYYDVTNRDYAYIHHDVIGKNKKRFTGMIRRYIEGKQIQGEQVAESFMDEILKSKKFPSLEALVDAGWVVEPSYIETLRGTMLYVYSRMSNDGFAKAWKEDYLDLYWKAQDKLTFFRENTGLLYLPQHDIVKTTKEIKDLNDKKKSFEIVGDVTKEEYHLVKNQLNKLNYKLKIMKDLQDCFEGKKEKIAGVKENVYGKQEITNAIFAADEPFIPANVDSYYGGRGIEALKGLDQLREYIKTDIKGLPPARLSNYEGLYFNRVLWKGMKNFVFRNDVLQQSPYSWLRTITRAFDKTNRVLKMIRFYKPTIIMANDLVQAGIANPMFIGNIPWAFKTYFNRNERDEAGKLTQRSQIYRDAENLNVFNKGVSMGDLVTDSARAVGDIMGKNMMFGDIDFQGNKVKAAAQSVVRGFQAWQSTTWGIDEIIRLATYKSMVDKFDKVYDSKRAKFMAAEWTNLFLVKYSRIPHSTRQVLNRVGFVLTYRIQTLRMYKEIMKMAGRGIGRMFGRDGEPVMYKQKKQALSEIMPLIRTLIMKGAVKSLLWQLFGFGYENLFDVITSYRGKRWKKGGVLDSELQFFSMGTPLWDMEKHITRLTRAPLVFLKYNMAAFPGLIFSWVTNSNIITGKRIVEADWAKQPKRALAQLGADILTSYIPLGGDISNLSTKDLTLVEHLINLFGLGYYYSYKNPRQLLMEFKEAIDKSQTFSDHQKALVKFQFALRKAYQTLFDRKYKDMYEQIEEAKKQLLQEEL